MSVHDAKLNDVYVDDAGKLWRVIALCGEPTVHVQEIESRTPADPLRKAGGVSGYMWHGFKRIYRDERSSDITSSPGNSCQSGTSSKSTSSEQK